MKFTHFLAMTGTVLLMGCTAITPMEKQHSGFLKDYSNMETVKNPEGIDVMLWVNPSLKKGTYKKVIVPPVVYYPAPKTTDQVKQETLDKISFHLTEQLRTELSKSFDVTDAAGPGTLKFQVAITGVETPVEGLKAWEITPITLAFSGASLATGSRDKVVVVYVEALTTDSVTGMEVFKGLRQGVGESLRDDKEQLDFEKVKGMLNGWAAELGKMAGKLL